MAQLFCAPTEYTDVLQLPRSILKGEDFTEGPLDESTLLALRDDLINNWDINYSIVNIGLVEKPFQHTCLYHLQDCVVNGDYLAI